MGALRFLVVALVAVATVYLLWKIIEKFFLDRSKVDEEVEEQLLDREKTEELLDKKKALKDMDRHIEEKKSKYGIED